MLIKYKICVKIYLMKSVFQVSQNHCYMADLLAPESANLKSNISGEFFLGEWCRN